MNHFIDYTLTPTQIIALHILLHNPAERIEDLKDTTEFSYNSYRAMAERVLKTSPLSRVRLLNKLGYISIPPCTEMGIDTNNILHMSILSDWHEYPTARSDETAGRLLYSAGSIRLGIVEIYMLHAPDMPSNRKMSRVNFYAHMGWLDTERMARDADEMLKEVAHVLK